MKTYLTSEVLVKHFDSKLPTELLTDASRLNGIGFALIQRNKEGTIGLISCGSRALTTAESRYATIELECLAILFALKKCRHFLLGMPHFKVITDHKPLVGIFRNPIDDMMNPRILRMRERMVNFSFKVQWIQGKNHHIADALSRSPVFASEEEDGDQTMSIICNKIATDPGLQDIYDATLSDQDYQDLIRLIKEDISPKSLPETHHARPYTNLWGRISIFDDTLLVLDGNRIIVPKQMRSKILDLLHISHSGITKTRQSANQLYYWPGINSCIKTLIDSCEACQEIRPRLPLDSMVIKTAEAPMDEIGVDLFSAKGKTFLIMVDRYSSMPFAKELRNTNTKSVTDQLLLWFREVGYARVCRSDNGPQFRSEFTEFCGQHNIKHETSSPYNPRSNGLAEAAVKSCKYLILKTPNETAFRDALMEFRNTPQADGFSPAQKFFGRRQRTQLPSLPMTRELIDSTKVADNHSALKQQREEAFTGQPLTDLPMDAKVRVQNPKSGRWDMTGRIIMKYDDGNSYSIETADQTLRRNRRFIKHLE